MGKPLPPIMGDNKSSATLSSSPASTNSGGKSTDSQNSGYPGILLGISGGWLVARMILLGGVLFPLEIIAIVITAGVAHSKGGKGQKVTAKIIMGLAVLNLFIPGFNSWVKGIRDNQLNPNTEQSVLSGDKQSQTQINQPPDNPTTNIQPSGEILEWVKEKCPTEGIILNQKEQIIDIPEGYELCQQLLIIDDQMSNLGNNVTIGDRLYQTRRTNRTKVPAGRYKIIVGDISNSSGGGTFEDHRRMNNFPILVPINN